MTVGLGADERFAQFDHALNTELSKHNQALLKAGQAMEEWTFGRLSGEVARKRLEASAEECQEVLSQLRALPARPVEEEIRKAYRTVCEDGQALLASALRFLNRGDPDGDSLKRFARLHLNSSSKVQKSWLRARQKALGPALSGSHGKLKQYYTWQSAVLPVQLEALSLSTRLQSASLADDPAKSSVQGATQSSLALLEQSQKIQPAPFLAEAHRAFLAEQMALTRLAEGVQLHLEDQSPDSASRLRRYSRRLAKAVQAAESARLKALGSAL